MLQTVLVFKNCNFRVECSHSILIPQGSTRSSSFWSQMKAHIFLITTPKFQLQIHYTLAFIMAAEMWIWRRMLGVSWKEKRTNASILSELDVRKELLGKIMTLKLAYFCHIMRGSGSPLTLQIVEGMVEGKRKRGRQKKQWFDNIREWTGLSYMRAKRSAQNRSAWRRTIKKCAEGGRQSSGVMAAAR